MIDVQERVFERDSEPVLLTPKAFDLLAVLVEHLGRLLTKEELLRTVWPDAFVEESNLAYNIFALRKALGDAAEDPKYIETVPKRGYRFIAAVVPTVEHRLQNEDSPDARAEASASGSPAIGSTGVPRRWGWVAVPIVVAATLYFAALSWGPFPDEPLRALPLTSLPGVVSSPSLSPDGNYVVFTWTGRQQENPDLYVQQIGSGTPLQLTSHPANDYSPSWSPDGRTIAFLRRGPGEPHSEVWLIAPLGGSARKLADIQPRLPFYRRISLSWCPDSRCVVVSDSPGPASPTPCSPSASMEPTSDS